MLTLSDSPGSVNAMSSLSSLESASWAHLFTERVGRLYDA